LPVWGEPEPAARVPSRKEKPPKQKAQAAKKSPIPKCRIPTIEFLTFFQKQKNKLNQVQQTL
jgi:hypothetical protein